MADIKILSRKGEAIKGALVAHVAPLLAADKKLKAGEIDTIILACDAAPYKKQRPIITKAFVEAFQPRMAKDDLDPDTVKELLLALAQGSQPSDDDGMGDEPEDGDDSAVEVEPDGTGGGAAGNPQEGAQATPEDHGKALSGLIAKAGSGLSPEEMEEGNRHIQALGSKPAVQKPKPPVAAATSAAAPAAVATDKFPPKEKKMEPEVKPDFLTKPAMDAALAAERKNTMTEMGQRFEAAKLVRPIVGEVNPMLFDSAEAILRAALDHAGVATKDVHASALKTIVEMHLKDAAKKDRGGRLPAMDGAAAKSFAEKYPNAPKLG